MLRGIFGAPDMPKDAVEWYQGFLRKVYDTPEFKNYLRAGRAQAGLRHRPRVREVAGRGRAAAPRPDGQGRPPEEVARTHARADLVTAVGAARPAALLVVWDALRLGIGWGSDGPKSGFFPFWLAALLLLAGVRRSSAQALPRGRAPPPSSRPISSGPVLKMSLPAVGLRRCSCMASGSTWRPRSISAATCAGSAATRGGGGRRSRLGVRGRSTFVVFETWFLVPMPKGPLEAWLGY